MYVCMTSVVLYLLSCEENVFYQKTFSVKQMLVISCMYVRIHFTYCGVTWRVNLPKILALNRSIFLTQFALILIYSVKQFAKQSRKSQKTQFSQTAILKNEVRNEKKLDPTLKLVTRPSVPSAPGGSGLSTKSAKMNAIKTKICDASTLILVARNSTLNSYFDYRILLLERAAKSAFMVS